MTEKTNYEIAKEVLNGEWGNGVERNRRLTEAGYDYSAVQSIVNALLTEPTADDVEPSEKVFQIDLDLSKYDGIEIHFVGI